MKDLTEQLLNQWKISPAAAILVMVAAAGISGIIIFFLFSLFIRKKNPEPKFSLFQATLKFLRRPLAVYVPLILLDIFLDVLDPGLHHFPRLEKMVEILLIVGFAWIILSVMKVVQDYVYYKYDFSKTDNLRERKIRTQLLYIRQIFTVFIILITIGAVLLSFSAMRRWGAGLLTGVGIGGIIVGFAAQRTLANILAGFQIAFTQPIRIDDVVVVEGEYGNIEEITLTYVVVRIWDKRRLVLPITYFIEKPFQNWTRTGSAIMGTVMIYVDYSVPVDLVREEFLRLLRGSKLWDGQVGALQVTDARERVLELRALVSANNAGEAFDLRCFIREQLIRFIRDNFPQSLPRIRTEWLGPEGSSQPPQPVKSS